MREASDADLDRKLAVVQRERTRRWNGTQRTDEALRVIANSPGEP